MSAIFGLIQLDGFATERHRIQLMAEALAHRGPDGTSILLHGSTGLGHCMLHSTPESLHEAQPLKRGPLSITADARIDNRDELFDRLAIDDAPIDQISDSDLIVRAYLEWGEDCPQNLVGDFSFALWDPRKHLLFCARDHLGVKPFYYLYKAGKRFIFASEIKAIVSQTDSPRTINETKIADFILGDFSDKTSTFYSDIARLPPASSLVVGRNGVRFRRYWTLDPEREIRLSSDAEYAEAFRQIFSEAVRCRLRSAFPIGSMLSGGLDSSSIACVAQELLANAGSKRLHTFSIVFDKTEKSDEREHISAVLDGKSFLPHFVPGDDLTPFHDIDTILWYQDEPYYAPNLFLNRKVWQVTKEAGVRVLLDGLFGDNVVSHGVEYFNELANRWRWLTLARELRRTIKTARRNVALHEPLLRYILERGIRPYVPTKGLMAWRRLRRQPQYPAYEQARILNREFCARTRVHERLILQHKLECRPRTARRAHADALDCGMIETALEIYNRGCAEFAIETRFPFADKRVVEFCLGIPGSQKISQGFSRMIVRRGLAGCLPESIRWRTDKGDLGWSFLNGFRSSGDTIEATIKLSASFLCEFISLEEADRLIARIKRGRILDPELSMYFVFLLSAWHLQLQR